MAAVNPLAWRMAMCWVRYACVVFVVLYSNVVFAGDIHVTIGDEPSPIVLKEATSNEGNTVIHLDSEKSINNHEITKYLNKSQIKSVYYAMKQRKGQAPQEVAKKVFDTFTGGSGDYEYTHEDSNSQYMDNESTSNWLGKTTGIVKEIASCGTAVCRAVVMVQSIK